MKNALRSYRTDKIFWGVFMMATLILVAAIARPVQAGGTHPATCTDYCGSEALAAANSCLPQQSREECLQVCDGSRGELAELTGCFLATMNNCDAMRFCESAEDESARFWILADGRTALMLGVIDETTPKKVKGLLAANPDLKTIILAYVPGSDDDDANLVAARRVRRADLVTVVPRLGAISSGGTDFFLAGRERVVLDRAGVGVHSWSDGDQGVTGRGLLPQPGHELHRPYLKYYREMGIPEDFYWFTLEAATSDEMHFMSREEMARYRIFTRP